MEALLSTLVDPYTDHQRHRYNDDFYPGDEEDDEEYPNSDSHIRYDFEGRLME